MNGEEIDLLFGMPACEYLTSKIADGSVLTEDGGHLVGASSIAFMVYAGYFNHCIMNGKPPKVKIGDFIRWVYDVSGEPGDVNAQQQLKAAGECWEASKEVARFKDKIDKQTEGVKKKIRELTGTKSSPSVLENSDAPLGSTGG